MNLDLEQHMHLDVDLYMHLDLNLDLALDVLFLHNARNAQPHTASAMTTAKQQATRTGVNTHVLFLPQREHCVTAQTYSKHQAEQRLRRTMCLASQRAEKRRRARLQRLQEAEARRYSRSR